MVIYAFDPGRGRPITQVASQGVTFAPLIYAAPSMSAACMYLEPGGLIGRHEAAVDQLLAVVQGEGEVSGADGVFVAVRPGLAALWGAGLSADGVLRMMRNEQ